MNIRQIQEARESYGIDDWGAGYFGINSEGLVTCQPTGEADKSVPLMNIIDQAREQGSSLPMIVRFPQVVECQLGRMHTAFKEAIWEYSYTGKHRGVFPYKVNQRREFIDSIVDAGYSQNYGLEVGSKTEFIAALSYQLAPEALLICNGFKDREFIEMSFIAKALGKNIILVVEGPDELQYVIDEAQKDPANCPDIGIRAKLYTRGSGKWEKSSGETSKFGLTTVEVLNCLRMLEKANMTEKLAMMHYHIGSQITEIKRIKNAIKEGARVYSKIFKMGFRPKYMNIGGGIGVDYDGSKTSFESSANYSLQEFANDVVYQMGDVCKNEGVDCPDIVTESGRVIAAYHSVVITDIREVQGEDLSDEKDDSIFEGINIDSTHRALRDLKYTFENISRKNYVEYYHDAIEYYEELFTLFNLGYVNLRERAAAEELFHRLCKKALYFSSYQSPQLEEFEDLQEQMVSKYLANFSIFQSIPDSWSIGQLFPVVPLSQHHKKPTHKAKIVDITCDSDGCLEKFVDRRDVKKVLDLHSPEDEPYFLGFFLVGAYQESLANEHNLFGAINEVEVQVDKDGNWQMSKLTSGDPIDELLECRNYDIEGLKRSFLEQAQFSAGQGRIDKARAAHITERLFQLLKSYPYLSK